jgi:ribonuclease P protein subunit RPR2
MRHKKNIKKVKNIALERIDILMTLAEEEAKKNRLDRVKRYVELSRRIAMKMRIPFPKKWKRRICKKCGAFLIFGKNARVRLKKDKYSYVAITCLECNNTVIIPLIREKKLKRKKNKNKKIKNEKNKINK